MIRVGVVAMALLVTACNEKSEDEVKRRFDESKRDLADRQVTKLAFEAYPIWLTRPANADNCPTLAQLSELTNGDTRDPWGAELQLRCTDLPPGASGIAISSAGPDGKHQTQDDVVSWDR